MFLMKMSENIPKTKYRHSFTYGAKAKHIAEGAKGFVDEIKSFDDKTELTKALLETLKDGDAVLFKASRGMKLEDVINSLYREWEE